jgi:hypothetical protein
MDEGQRKKTSARALSSAAIAAAQLPRRKILVVRMTTRVLKFDFFSRRNTFESLVA